MSKDLKDINIRQIKLSNNDNLIALVSNKTKDYLTVERPALMFYTDVDRYQLEPWFELSDQNTYKINRIHVISDMEVAESIKEIYIKYSTSVSIANDNDGYPSTDGTTFH